MGRRIYIYIYIYIYRFQSHKEFHERCLKDQVIPNALKVNLEPSIGNHDEEYLKIWYQEIEELSRKLAKHTINYCDKTIVQASNDIKTVEEELLNVNATNIQVTEIKKTITINQETRKRHLKRNKDRKFYNLKYH